MMTDLVNSILIKTFRNSVVRTSLKDKMDKLNGGTKNSAVSSPNPKNIKQEKEKEKTEEVKQNKTNPIRMVTSHGDTPMINTESGKIGKYLIRRQMECYE